MDGISELSNELRRLHYRDKGAGILAEELWELGYRQPVRLPKCGLCGGQMSENPHPDAGKPDSLLTVGASYYCIPCGQMALHGWAERALKAEGKLEQNSNQPGRLLSPAGIRKALFDLRVRETCLGRKVTAVKRYAAIAQAQLDLGRNDVY